MKLNIELNEKREIENFFIVFTLGLLTNVKFENNIIDMAERYLFNPYSVSKMKNCDFDIKLIEIIEECCELEDVKEMLGEKELDKVIEDLIQKAFNAESNIQLPVKKIASGLKDIEVFQYEEKVALTCVDFPHILNMHPKIKDTQKIISNRRTLMKIGEKCKEAIS